VKRTIGALSVLALLLTGCPQVQILEVEAHPDDCVLVVHSQTTDLAHVAERCRVEAVFGQWRGVGSVPMVRGLPEPQDVYSQIRAWERGTFGRIPEGQVRVRFFYQHNELLAEEHFPAPDFDPGSLYRRRSPLPDADSDFWPDPDRTPPGSASPPNRVR
jgi:hypothetical protein